MGAARGGTSGRLLPADAVPPVGSLLDVAPHRAAPALTARLLDSGHDRLVLGPPTDVLGTPTEMVEGEEVDLVWGEHGDVVGVAALLERRTGPGWTAVVVAPPQRVQRRDAVRVPVDLRATLARDGAGDGAPGTLDVPVADLSESGARCVVDPVALRLEQGERVRLGLPVAGLSGPLAAQVVHRRFRAGSRGVLVGLRLVDLSDGDADVLRRHVFARLRELRRRGAL
ncbi:PilZ domain-containing protein [Pseudokineococcus basanitobsidens]|uniref:PilZ domain-containing protein n=1 Tax=Pseudokineococcus basanitobsidens TaxID=1926649 RepID=A0ABU8RGE0_9ACTN